MLADDMDAVFRALAAPARRSILDLLHERPGATVGEVAREFPTSRIAVMRHLALLEEADLVRSVRSGRERRLYLNVVPLQQIMERWSTTFSQGMARGLTQLKANVERGLEGGRDEQTG